MCFKNQDQRWKKVNALLDQEEAYITHAALAEINGDQQQVSEFESKAQSALKGAIDLVEEIEGSIPEQVKAMSDRELLEELGLS